MKLNCRPGDLAIVVVGENSGKLVDVIQEHPIWGRGVWRVVPHSNVSSTFGHSKAGAPIGCDDYRLRPIRPDEGDDETLTWAGKPEKVTA